jgi:hypothetical protein
MTITYLNYISNVSFVVFSTQMSYSITNSIFDLTSVAVLVISGVFAMSWSHKNYEITVDNTIDEILQTHINNVNTVLEEITMIHEDITINYATNESRIDDDVTVDYGNDDLLDVDTDEGEDEDEGEEGDCIHDYKRVVLGYDDMVRQCTKCNHEL